MSANSLWWAVPQKIAGMPMPFLHVQRRMDPGADLAAYPDDLPALHAAGIRAVVCLLNIPRDKAVYEAAGFAFLCVPVADGGTPSFEQAGEFVRFVTDQHAAERPVAVHCEAGLGRTGTLIAAYLIFRGANARMAIQQVRRAEPCAIETSRQIQFLEQYARALEQRGRSR